MRLIFRKFYQMRFNRRKIYLSPFFAIIQLTSRVQKLVKSLTKSTVKNTPPGNKKSKAADKSVPCFFAL